MSPLGHRVRLALARHRLCPPGARLIVALSGGSDSVALLHLLRELAGQGPCTVAGVAHLNHQLRPTAARDEAFCRELAARLACPIDVGAVDVGAVAVRDGLSIEDAARRERYAFLDQAAARAGASVIATGHTRDDQAETVLLKLARGAGLTGLGGIYPRRGRVIRPLLDITRLELRAYLDARGERWVDDETNADRGNPRNRVRLDILPVIEEALGPGVGDALARTAAQAADDGPLLDELAGGWFARLAEPAPDGLGFARDALAGLPPALLRRVLLRAMRQHASPSRISATHVEQAMDVVTGLARACEGSWGRWELLGARVVLLREGWDAVGASPGGVSRESFRYDLPLPGRVRVPEAGVVISAERLARPPAVSPARTADEAAITAAVSRLSVRSRRPGDRVGLPGQGGSRKLQDVLVDARVPRRDRDRVPLVVDGDDRIVWVPGLTVGAGFHASGAEDPVILLTLSRTGEEA